MYLEHFGLTINPFSISPRLDFLYRSGAFEESMAHLIYGLENSEAIVMITGAIGTGKTMAIQSFLAHLGARFVTALVTNTSVDGRELLKLILDDLGVAVEPQADKSDLLIAFKKFLISSSREHARIVIVIDEAQNLTREVLEEIRQLTNLGQGDDQPVQIVLVGQPELEANVGRPDLAQLRQRIRVHYKLAPLSRRELEEYIDHRMVVAGGSAGVFSGGAIDRIFAASGGIPRVVNTLCGDALLAAFVAGRKQVEPGDLEDGIARIAGPEPSVKAEPTSSDGPEATPAPRPHKAAMTPESPGGAPMAVRRDSPIEPKPRSAGVGVKSRSPEGATRSDHVRVWWVGAVLLVVAAFAWLAATGRLPFEPFALSTRSSSAPPGELAASDAVRSPIGEETSTLQDATADVAAGVPGAGADSLSGSASGGKALGVDGEIKVLETAAAGSPVEVALGGERAEASRSATAPATGGDQESVGGTSASFDDHYIHVSSFRTRAQADSEASRFGAKGEAATVQEMTVRGTLWYRVYLGPVRTHDDAVALADRLRAAGLITYYKVVRLETGVEQ